MGCTFTDIIRVSKSRGMRWAGRVVRMGENVCKGFVGKTLREEQGIEGGNIKIDFKGVGWDGRRMDSSGSG